MDASINIFVLATLFVLFAGLLHWHGRGLRKKIEQRDAVLADTRTRLEANYGIRVFDAHITAAWANADGASKLAMFSDGSLRKVLLLGQGKDLTAYYGSDQGPYRVLPMVEVAAR